MVVNIGSMRGVIVNRLQLQSYCDAPKAAVHRLTGSPGAEWASRGVRVEEVAPLVLTASIVPADSGCTCW